MQVDVCITTAPRNPCTLPQCRESLRRAGWEHVAVYAEPDSDLRSIDLSADRFVQRSARFGAWRNWLFAALDMVNRSNAEAILMVQDDTVWAADAKEKLDRLKWPSTDVGYIQCAVSSGYARWCDGKSHGLVRLPKKMVPVVMGAWGTLFPRDVLARVVDWGLRNGWHGDHVRRGDSNWHGDPVERKAVDAFFGRATASLGLSAWVWYPSLAQHLCRNRGSTLGHDQKSGHALAIRSALGWKERA